MGLAVALVSASVSQAQEGAGDYVYYSLNMDGSKVKGSMIVARLVDNEEVPTGYSLKRVVEFITEDCASGKLRNVKLAKRKTIARKRIVIQNFSARCLGGPHPSIGADQKAKVRVERQDDGRDLARYSHWKDGDTVVIERYRGEKAAQSE